MRRDSRPLPSLAGLQAFEAAARNLSFRKAAEELGLTPTAISHRLRSLEADLGVILFQRCHRSVRLTEAGERVARDLSESFDCIKVSVARLRGRSESRLVIFADPSFAACWLVPKLPDFQRRHQRIRIRIEVLDHAAPLEHDEGDAAIVVATEHDRGEPSDCLFQNCLVPVCTPVVARSALTGNGALNLAETTLLHTRQMGGGLPLPGWEEWLRAAGTSRLVALDGVNFGSPLLAIEAARCGQGIALSPNTLVADDLASGRLVAPFTLALPIPHAYALTYPREHASRPALRVFRSWLLGQVQERLQPFRHGGAAAPRPSRPAPKLPNRRSTAP